MRMKMARRSIERVVHTCSQRILLEEEMVKIYKVTVFKIAKSMK